MVKVIELLALVSIYIGLLSGFLFIILFAVKGSERLFKDKIDEIILKIAIIFICASGLLMLLGDLTSHYIKQFSH